ncbi:hypothetical protein [Sulfurimonas sp.]|uniref:hypothetical protein n=1 Tax=Sulfurimonas sp. TaxID=2022749 RepID=UPI003D0E70EA
MKFLFLLITIFSTLFATEADDTQQKQLKNLEMIEHYGIKIGTGDAVKMYIFVDPLCPHSRALIKKIYDNKMLQLSNSHYIMFYKLPRFDSEKTMHYILESSKPKEALIEVMVDEKVIDVKNILAKPATSEALKAITNVAKTLEITQRPYMISFEKDSKYCRVSEGSVSCLEELED